MARTAGVGAVSSTSTGPPSNSPTAAATSAEEPPRSTRSVSRSCASSARFMASLCDWIVANNDAVSIAMAAWSASDDSSATSSGGNSRGVRSAAYSTPITVESSFSGTPRIATRPSSRTAESIGRVWLNRASAK